MRMVRSLLWIDCGAGLLAGALVVLCSAWLSRLYALPVALLLAIGIANLAYGAFSFSLARRAARPPALLALLVIANASWAVACGVMAVAVAPYASGWGLAHLLVEGLFVGGLAALEWRYRRFLLARS